MALDSGATLLTSMYELRFISEAHRHRPEIMLFPGMRLVLGRDVRSDVMLGGNQRISRRHAEIAFEGGVPCLYDRSTHGTLVNGKPMESKRVELESGDVIGVEEYQIRVINLGDTALDRVSATAEKIAATEGHHKRAVPDLPVEAGDRARLAQLLELKKRLHVILIDYLEIWRINLREIPDDELWNRTQKTLEEVIDRQRDEIPDWVDLPGLKKDILEEALGLGPLEDLLADSAVSEIMAISPTRIFVERDGKITLSSRYFSSADAMMAIIERIVTPLGRRIDESSPMVDARLKDGSRVNAIIPPLALKGPCLTIRKFSETPLGPSDLVRFGSLTAQMVKFLDRCVRLRCNVLISGGTGSGKTTLLNILSSFIPDDERIVTIEDAAELQLGQEHVVSLESRPPNLEGRGQVTIRDLVKNSLRMRPDRIVIGECRGAEALDMLQAMNTGHDGSLTTLHANTPVDAIARVENMVLQAGQDLPIRAIREQIASSINIVIQQTRFSDGSRRVTYVSEVAGLDDEGRVVIEDIFRFQQKPSAEGKVQGHFIQTGYIPSFVYHWVEAGLVSSTDFM